MRSSKARSRSKMSRSRSVGNIINRVFDSSGPEGKVRGTPQQIIDKYNQLARDAALANDRVAAENFQQHSEHYTRLLGEALRELEAQRQASASMGWGQQGGQQGGGQGHDHGFSASGSNGQNGNGQGNGENGGNAYQRRRDEREPRPVMIEPRPDRTVAEAPFRDDADEDVVVPLVPRDAPASEQVADSAAAPDDNAARPRERRGHRPQRRRELDTEAAAPAVVAEDAAGGTDPLEVAEPVTAESTLVETPETNRKPRVPRAPRRPRVARSESAESPSAE